MPAGLSTLKWIPQGYFGTARTVVEMKRLVDNGKKNPAVIQLATDIVRNAGVAERDHAGEGAANLAWIQANIHFMNDPWGVETIRAPMSTVKRGAGDCDDLAILYNSLMASIGYNTRFKTIKAEAAARNEFTHVYSQVLIDGQWASVDPSQKQPFGWEPPNHYGAQVWGYSTGALRRLPDTPPTMKGLGMLGATKRTQVKLDLKSAIMNAFAGKRTIPVVPVAPISAAAPAGQTFVQRPDELEFGFDPEVHPYYADYDDDNGGGYSFERFENVTARGTANLTILPLPKVWNPSYAEYENRRLDKKFAGRQKFGTEIPNLNAIKDGTPQVVEEF